MNIAEPVRLIRRGVDRIGIDAVLDPWREVARDDRRAGDAVRPRYRLALRVHARAQAVVVVRAIHVVLDVFLASPDHLDGPPHLPGVLHGPHLPAVPEARAESPPQQMMVDP